MVVARETHRRGRQRLELAAGQVAAHRDVVFGGRRPHRVVHRVAPRRPRLGLDQDLRHVGVLGPLLDLADRALRLLDGHADRAAPALMPVVVAVQPVIGQPLVRARAERRVASGSRISPWVGSRIAMSEPASMMSCLKARSGSLPANSPSAGKVSTPHRVGVRVVGGVVVDLLADLVAQEILGAPGLGDVSPAHRAAASGARRSRRSAPRCARRGHASVVVAVVEVIADASSYPLLCRNDGRNDGTFYAVQLSGVAPAELFALFGGVAPAPSVRPGSNADSSSRTSSCRPCR